MEQKLAEYRARKAREAKINEIKTKTNEFLSTIWNNRTHQPEEELLVPPEESSEVLEDSISVASDDESCNCWTWTDLLYYFLWFLLWAILYWIFIKLQFGTVFLIVSGIVFIFVNTRTTPKRANEVSAYSVFNKNCESIDGTLKAEQFEREIRYGHSAVH